MNDKHILTSAERQPDTGYTVYRHDAETGQRISDPLSTLSTQELESVADVLGQQVAQSEAYWLQFEATPDKEANQSYEAHEAWRKSVRKGDK